MLSEPDHRPGGDAHRSPKPHRHRADQPAALLLLRSVGGRREPDAEVVGQRVVHLDRELVVTDTGLFGDAQPTGRSQNDPDPVPVEGDLRRGVDLPEVEFDFGIEVVPFQPEAGPVLRSARVAAERQLAPVRQLDRRRLAGERHRLGHRRAGIAAGVLPEPHRHLCNRLRRLGQRHPSRNDVDRLAVDPHLCTGGLHRELQLPGAGRSGEAQPAHTRVVRRVHVPHQLAARLEPR